MSISLSSDGTHPVVSHKSVWNSSFASFVLVIVWAYALKVALHCYNGSLIGSTSSIAVNSFLTTKPTPASLLLELVSHSKENVPTIYQAVISKQSCFSKQRYVYIEHIKEMPTGDHPASFQTNSKIHVTLGPQKSSTLQGHTDDDQLKWNMHAKIIFLPQTQNT